MVFDRKRLRALCSLLFLLVGLVGPGCSRKSAAPAESREDDRSAAAAPAAAKAEAPAATAGAAAPAASAAPGGERKAKEVTTWKRSNRAENAARLSVGDKEELPLAGMQVNVRIEGFRARVVLDCYFANDRDRQLEGTFQLRLPDEASPYFFAFGETVAKAADPLPLFGEDRAAKLAVEPAGILADRAETWTAPKEARMVPREKAAHAYGETVRRRVDPALVEWAGAGVFNARVFPLAPRKLHRIVIGYDADLVPAGDDLEYAVALPDALPRAVVDLRVVVPGDAGVSVTPEAPSIAQEGGLRYRFTDPKERTISVRFKRPGAVMLTAEDARTGPYFAASFRPDLGAAPQKPAVTPAAGKPAKAAKVSASHVERATSAAGPPDAAVFLLDTSLSSNPDKLNVWLALLEAVLERNRDVLRRFAVAFFDIEARWHAPGFVENTKENVAALLAAARELSLEGATDLGAALSEAASPSWLEGKAGAGGWDVFLLSDAASTWGEADAFALARKLGAGRARALYAYRTGMQGTETALLEHLARESGGAVFSVVGEAEVAAAAVAHRTRPWQLVRVEVPGGSDILVAGRPRVVFPGQVLRVVGRGAPEKGAPIGLVLQQGGKERTLQVRLGASIRSDLATRAYGQVAVAQLEELEAATEDMAAAYATYFRVTGKTCSLLMLETEDDYRRQGVRPEDPEAIRGSPASDGVAKALVQIGEYLGDPKAAFLTWLSRLTRAPGMKLTIPDGLREAIGQMPSSAFDVRPPRLGAKSHLAKDVPGSFRELSSMQKLDYDAVTSEAERRRKELGPADALKALSSLVEERPGDGVLARDVAFSAMEWGLAPHAYHLLRRVAIARPYEPQTYRAIARCLEGMGNADLAIAYFEIGILGEWDARFGEFRRIVGLEYVHLLRRLASGQAQASVKPYAAARLEQLEREFEPAKADLVITITWNTDATDVDLHVVEPTGEECYYSHPRTKIGGRITQDVTRGYGPEMYVLEQAKAGQYRVWARYFATDQNRASARTKVHAVVFQGWGTQNERVTEKVVPLELNKQNHDILTLAY